LKVFTLRREQLIPGTRAEVFAFFERPENLARITPENLGFVILTPSPIQMRTGAVIDYTIGLFGLRLHWRTLITGYEPPLRFADVCLKGPYAFWHHTHSFHEAPGGTLMVDEVRYCLPFGWVGRLAHNLWVRRQLQTIFDFRAKVIAGEFAALEATRPQPPVDKH